MGTVDIWAMSLSPPNTPRLTTPINTMHAIREPVGLSGPDQRAARIEHTVILGDAFTGPWCARALGLAPGDPRCVVVMVGRQADAAGSNATDDKPGSPDDAPDRTLDANAHGLKSVYRRHDRVGTTWVVCLPNAMRDELEAIQAEARGLGIALQRVTPAWEQIGWDAGRVSASSHGVSQGSQNVWTPTANPASLNLAELIGRAQRPVDDHGLRDMIGGRRVLVTGAGGSIGSELARCCAALGPSAIALVERSEHALFQIDRELRETRPDLDRSALLHDVVDAPRTRRVVESFAPDIVLHAAAHKHVPLMEDHPADAVHNNVFGTVSIANAARHAGASRFVLISSDKAVRPSSVMGATKRIAELYVSALAQGLGGASGVLSRSGPAGQPQTETSFASVRFGNVLGSSGSVLTIWADQLRSRGRITVTDPRMTRYFMTIPEAAALVLQAAALARPGSADTLFVLDMGEPVRIVDLASRFLRASGLNQRDADAAIEITGIRPGEKLHEALAYEDEALMPTTHPAITCLPQRTGTAANGRAADLGGLSTPGELNAMLSDLDAARGSTHAGAVIDALARHVPEFGANRAKSAPAA
jgi:nucleoside-diphosphate-sugar epimerase